MNDTTSLRCELCETPMTCESPPGRSVRYFHCAHCGRWVASNYGEELMRAHTACEERPGSEPKDDLGPIKASLARWLEALDERDPYFVLGVPPSAQEDQVRARFKELALVNHPDQGGDAAAMRRLITAYDRIRCGKRLHEAPRPVQAPARAASHRR
jgi:hypothetical protein